jgi:hypothetical protein
VHVVALSLPQDTHPHDTAMTHRHLTGLTHSFAACPST